MPPQSLTPPVQANTGDEQASNSGPSQGASHPVGAPRPLGGVFSPVAQYPGMPYAKVLSTSKDLPYKPDPKEEKLTASSKTIVRTKAVMQNMKAHFYTNALLLVEVDDQSRMDKKALRDAGIGQVQVLTSGMLAARFLSMQWEESAENTGAIDIVFCHPRLEDMSAMQWLELIRQHPKLVNIPVVVITGNSEEAQILTTIGDGFDGLLLRPYAQDDVRRLLGDVQESFSRALPHDMQDAQSKQIAFSTILKQLESYQGEGAKAEMNFREGLRHVKEKSWDAAIQALTKALYHKDVKGEAEYGLAAAWQGKQNREKHIYYLSEACTTFVRTQKWARARLAYTQLLRVLPTAENPFLRLAESHLRSAAYKEAAGALVLGLNLGNAQNAVTRVARACLFTENPPFTLGQIQKAFTPEELQALVKALPEEMERLHQEHTANMLQHREEYAHLQAQARAMPLQESVLNLQKKQAEQEKAAYDPASYTGHTGDMSGAIPGMPSLIDAQKSYEDLPTDKGTVLEPLDHEERGVELFSAFPRLNEMATVVKVTWKLMQGKQ